MNPIKTFGKNVIEGAKLVTPGRVVRGIKDLVSPKKVVAAKMSAPKPMSPASTSSDFNPGFKAYKNNLDEALKY